MKTISMALGAVAIIGGLSTFAKEAASASSKSEYESAVITFTNGGQTLSSTELSKLRSALNTAKSKGEITSIEVAAWSDKGHPLKGDLAKPDRELAEKRIETIKQDLTKDGLNKHISSYNMAENANWLDRNLHSSKAELDATFAKKDKSALAREDFELIKEYGAPSKAVIIFRIRK